MRLQIGRMLLGALAAALLAALLINQFGTSGTTDLTTARTPTKVVKAATIETEVLSSQVIVQNQPAEPVAGNVNSRSAALQAASRFTGDAERDLAASDPAVTIIADLVDGVQQRDVPLPLPSLPHTYDLGWDIKDLRVKYVAASDELIIALNSYGVVGDPEGNGDPATFDRRWINAGAGGVDALDLGGLEGVTIGIDLDEDGEYDVVAGVSYTYTIAKFGVFEFERFGLRNPLTQSAYGSSVGTLAARPISPSLESPDLVFSIANFSALPGNDDSLDFGINAINGSGIDGDIGEDTIGDFATPMSVVIDAEIGDLVWSDVNANGIQDDGEPGIEGYGVNLLDADGAVSETTTTDANGAFLFTVTPGRYVIEVVPSADDSISAQHQGEIDDKDSDIDPVTGRSAIVVLGPGSSNHSIDAGIIRFIANPSIDIETATNGLDADSGTGPELEVGSTVSFTYDVTNTGNVELERITVTDEQLGAISCPRTVLPPGESMVCTATSIVVAGAYTTTGGVVARPTFVSAGDPIVDRDPSRYFGFVPFQPEPEIDLEMATNGQDADDPTGPALLVGDEATFTFVAENTGNVDVINVTITDGILGEVCAIERLAPGEQLPCEATAPVTEGQYVSVSTAAGTAVLPDGSVLPDPVTAEDPSHHVGVIPGPACVTTMHGPRMYHTSTVVDETGLVAAAGSKIYIVTSEPGASPDQPNEQVYVQVGEDLYGPTPAGLGEFQFTVENSGPVTILHYSVVTGDTSMSNSVEYDWCGSDLERPSS